MRKRNLIKKALYFLWWLPSRTILFIGLLMAAPFVFLASGVQEIAEEIRWEFGKYYAAKISKDNR